MALNKRITKQAGVKRKKMRERLHITNRKEQKSNQALESVNMEMLIATLQLNLKKNRGKTQNTTVMTKIKIPLQTAIFSIGNAIKTTKKQSGIKARAKVRGKTRLKMEQILVQQKNQQKILEPNVQYNLRKQNLPLLTDGIQIQMRSFLILICDYIKQFYYEYMNSDTKISLGTIRRRVFTKTQLSGLKSQQKQHDMMNNFFQRQNKFGTIESYDQRRQKSQGSLSRHNKARSYSNKNLFQKARNSDHVPLFYCKQKKIDNFIVPKKNNRGEQKIDKEGKKKRVISSMLDKMVAKKKPQLQIHRTNEETIRNVINTSLISTNEKNFYSRRKIQHILSLKFDSRKQNLQRSQRIMTQLISDATQTEEAANYTQNFTETEENQKQKQKEKEDFQETKNQKTIKKEKEVTKPKRQLVEEKKQENQKKGSFFAEVNTVQNLDEIGVLESVKMTSKKDTIKSNVSKPVEKIQEIKKEQKPSNQNLKIPEKEQKKSYKNSSASEYSDELENVVLAAHSKVASKPQKSQKDYVKEQMLKVNQIIDMVTPLGEVASYCSQDLKKAKINWMQPAILMYKQCYFIFKNIEPSYKKALELKLISQQDNERFLEDNERIRQNLQNLLVRGRKKNKIKEQYEALLKPSSTVDLQRYIQQETMTFVNAVMQGTEKDSPQALLCSLRMINGVLILAKLRGKNIELIDTEKKYDLKEMTKILEKNLQVMKGKALF